MGASCGELCFLNTLFPSQVISASGNVSVTVCFSPQQTLQQKWVELRSLLVQEQRLLHGTSAFPGGTAALPSPSAQTRSDQEKAIL